MDTDVLKSYGFAFLGSYLKRISDRFISDAAKIINTSGFDLNPSQIITLSQISAAKRISVNNLAYLQRLSQPAITRNLTELTKLGLIEMELDFNDHRVKFFSLTIAGEKLIREFNVKVRDKFQIVVGDFFEQIDPSFIEKLKHIEKSLDEKSFEQRFNEFNISNLEMADVKIIEFKDELSKDFYDISAQWIQERFVLEDVDKEVLLNPKEKIIDQGGTIVFAEHKIHGIIGTCALMKIGDAFELTKMGIVAKARGLKIGETLLIYMLKKAKEMKIKKLFLLTNSSLKAAIHLYEKHGFVHSKEIMEEFGHEYERSDVAMLYTG